MADAQKTIDLIFNGVDKTGAAVQSAIGNTSKLAGSVQSATQPFADVTLAALKFEAAILAASTAAAIFAVKTAGDFDGAFREISTLIDEPIDALNEFRQAILDYASGSTAPLEQVTTAIYSAISAGADFSESIDVVAQAEKLSVAGKADLNASLVVLVSSLNAYGLGMDSAERFSDALFTTVKLGQTTLPELASGLALITGTAATLEVPFETVLSAIAALTAQGTPTTQAITQINAAMAALIKPSADASALAAELGIEFDAQAVKAKGLDGVLQDVARATGGNEEQMGRLFGSVEALRAVFPLTGAAAGKFSEALTAMEGNAGATDAAFGKMADSLDISTQKITNAFKGLLIATGDPLLDEFGGVAESIAAIFNALGASAQAADGLGPLLDYVEGVVGEIDAAFATIAGNLPEALAGVDTTKAIAGLESLRQAVSGIFDGVDLTTAEGLEDFIQRAADAFGNLSEFSAGAIEGLEPLIDIAARLFDSFAEMDSATARANGEAFGFATTVNILSGFVAGLLPSLETLLSIFIIGKGGVGLIGAFKAGAVAVGGAGGLGAALGAGGLFTAAGLAGVAVGKLADKAVELGTGKGLSDRLSDWFTGFTDLDEQALELTRTLEVTRGEVEKPTGANGIGDALEEIVVNAKRITPELLTGPLQEIEVTATRVTDAFKDQRKAIDGVIPVLDEATGAIIGYTDGASSAGKTLDIVYDGSTKAAKAIKSVGESADEMRVLSETAFLKLEELASNERITNIEARVTLNVAELEADTERTLAAFDSINTSINSTGDLLGSLFGNLANAGGLREEFAIERQIDEENRRRDDALKLQKDLTEAQIKEINARAKAIGNGDALIKVDGAGLQPHLEAFMFEILSAIQVRVNSEGEELLLGIG